MRFLRIGLFALSSVVLCFSLTNRSWLENAQHWVINLTARAQVKFDPAATESRIGNLIEVGRRQIGRASLQADVDLHNWLALRLQDNGEIDLNALSAEVQALSPGYEKLGSTAVQSATSDGLLEQVVRWNELDDEDFTHLTVVARQRPAGGYECVVFAGKKLKGLMPELIGHGQDQFYSVCPLCGHGQSGEVKARHRTVFLSCANCRRVYAVMAYDTHGVYHYVSQYLSGYSPHAYFPARLHMNRFAEMVRIWGEVVHTVDYLPDSPEDSEDYDIWQTAPETEKLGTGDCEDYSIYLADWLASRGFEARVVIGDYGNKGGHAWVTVRLDGNCYLLECTDPKIDITRPPLTSEASKLYVPKAMFDRNAIYVPRFERIRWTGDYWSPEQWVQVQSPSSSTYASVASHVAQATKAKPKAAAPSPN